MNRLCLPKKVYFKEGSAEVALRELKEIYHIESALIVTSAADYVSGAGTRVIRYLEKLGIRTSEFFIDKEPLTVDILEQSRILLQEFEPEAVIPVGNAMIMEAGKLIRLLMEYPDMSAADLLHNIEDGQLRTIIGGAGKVLSIMIPTTFAEGAQNTPYATVSSEDGSKCYSDISLLADMSITDVQYVQNMTSDQIHFEGIMLKDKCVTAMESEDCSPYVAGFLKEAVNAIEENLSDAENGSLPALEKLHNAGSIAGNAFGNL